MPDCADCKGKCSDRKWRFTPNTISTVAEWSPNPPSEGEGGVIETPTPYLNAALEALNKKLRELEDFHHNIACPSISDCKCECHPLPGWKAKEEEKNPDGTLTNWTEPSDKTITAKFTMGGHEYTVTGKVKGQSFDRDGHCEPDTL